MADSERPVLEFQNVSVSFNEVPALIDVSLSLYPQEMIFLTGVSAAGKSVLLHLAMGLRRPDEGRILVNGNEIEHMSEESLLNIRGECMGMVFQEESLFTGLTVFDNIAYRLDEHGWDVSRISEAVAEALRFVGLEGEEEKFPEELSGGMKRRVEIARALVGWPPIMLYDEPTSSLDPLNALQVLNLTMRARDLNKVSSIYVTKKLHEIFYLSDYRAITANDGEVIFEKAVPAERPKTRVVMLDNGRVIFEGSAAEFQDSTHPRIVEMKALDQHNHLDDPYFTNPWDKNRLPREPV